MNLLSSFNDRPVTVCWRFDVKVHTSSKKRTAFTVYSVIGLDESLAISTARDKAKNKTILSIEVLKVTGVAFAYYNDEAELPSLTEPEKAQLFTQYVKQCQTN